jgi:hypothetical protein
MDKQERAEREARFWQDPVVKAEFALWSEMTEGFPGWAAKLFWAQQETQDRYREVTRGKKLTATVIDTRHEIALEWNALYDSGELDQALWYESGVMHSTYDYDPPETFSLGLTRKWVNCG